MSRKIVFGFFLICWMALIFFLSHQPGNISSNTSNGIVNKIVSIVENITNREFSQEEIDQYFSFPIRKLAHFTLYLILGILFYNFIYQYKFDLKLQFWISILFCILYSCTDEVHQMFIVGRSGEIRDVLIDVFGSCLGVFLIQRLLKGLKRNSVKEIKI